MLQLKMFYLEKRSSDDFFHYDGLLKIGKAKVGVRFFLYHWPLQDYLDQWREGIERIKTHNTSCLITGFENAKIIDGERYSARLSWIVLYKKNNKVIIQELSFYEAEYDVFIGKNIIITKENYYDYIPEYNQYYPIYFDISRVSWQLNKEEFNKNFTLKITNETINTSGCWPSVLGVITIGSYVDEFKINVSVWSAEDYKQQWKEGIERLQNYSSTCLVTWVEKPENGLSRWLLYKRDGNIIFYYDSFYGIDYSEEIGDILVTKENCYDFIPDEQEHLEKYRVKEWEVDLKEFDGLEVIWPEE